jgi:uncharacterized protein (TIGR03435 family)
VSALLAQSSDVTAWQIAAGGKMVFDVASVKPSKMFRPASFPLDNRNAFVGGGRFSASLPLSFYITFAYKIPPNEADLGHLPAWVGKDFFSIDARADGNPSKDQMRLMMQSLLTDRFKLAIHFELREVPVFELVLIRPGKIGPKLIPHSQGPPCPESFAMSVPPSASDVFPRNCETVEMGQRNGARLLGDRNTSMQLLADAIYRSGSMAGEVDRPVVDKTGLSGRFDFTIEFTPGENDGIRRSVPPVSDAPPPDPQGAPFLHAMREQLGLKLVPSKGQIRMLVVDHVEMPSEN